jgi:hypothetical protein
MSRAAQPFNPRLVVGLIVAGIIAFAALVLLIAYGGDLNRGRGDARGDALSKSAIGFHALATLAGEFRQTRLVRDDSGYDAENLLVVTLEPQSEPGALRRLLERRGPRPTLVILPKWAALPDQRHPGWVRVIGPGAGAFSARALGKGLSVDLARDVKPGRAVGRGILDGLVVPVPASPQLISGPQVTPLVAAPGSGALVARIGDRPLYVAADPDLFNNHGMPDAANARAALEIIDGLNETGTDRVDFDLTMNGLGATAARDRPNMLRTALEPPFLAMTLALIAAALLAGLHGAFRSGPTRREVRALPFGKAALVENSAGLIRLARREATLGPAYVEVVRHEAARAATAPHWLRGEKLDAYLDRLTRPGSDSFSTLALRLGHAHDRAGLIEAARALLQWKKDAIP